MVVFEYRKGAGMTVSVAALKLLIMIATGMVAVVPVLLLIFWIKDKKGDRLW